MIPPFTGLLLVPGPELFVARLPSGFRTSGGMCGVLKAYPFWMGGGGGGPSGSGSDGLVKSMYAEVGGVAPHGGGRGGGDASRLNSGGGGGVSSPEDS